MHMITRKSMRLHIALAALVGFVDAAAFLMLGGLFVAAMSGNGTIMSVSFAQNSGLAPIAALMIGAFLLGVIAGSALGQIAGDRRRTAVLALVAVLLALAAVSSEMRWVIASGAAMAAAVGVANRVVELDDGSIGAHYFLTSLGHRLAKRLSGDAGADWVPFALLAATLVLGAMLGAATYIQMGAHALWPAVAIAAILAFTVQRP